MNTVRVGIIGTGFMAAAHAACFGEDPRVEIVCVSSRREQSCRRFAARYGLGAYTADWKELVADEGVDLVDITAPNYLHAEMAVAAAERGKAFIVEKPLALTVDSGRRVCEAAEGNGVTGFYAENRLFAPIFARAKEMIDAGRIGDPLILRINELGSGPTHGDWFWDKSKAGGGALIDMGIHGLCLSEWLLAAEIVSVQAVSDTLKWSDRSGSAEDTVMSLARFDSGALGQFICSWAVEGGLDIRVELFGSEGTIYLDQARSVNGVFAYSSGTAKTQAADSESEGAAARPHAASETGWFYPLVDEWNVRGHRRELRHFIDCFIDKTEPISSLRRGLRALKLVHAIYESADKRAEVPVHR